MQWQYSVVSKGPIQALPPCANLILPPQVPTHRLELGLLCRLCSFRHFQMTQQLTHLLCKHTHIHTLTRTPHPPPAAPREAYAAQKPCALIQPLRIQHTLRASAETPALIPSSWLCLSAHLPVFRSLSPPSPPHIFTHSTLWEDTFFFFCSF